MHGKRLRLEMAMELIIHGNGYDRLVEAEIRELTQDDLGAALECQEEIMKLTPSDLFVRTKPEEIKEHISSSLFTTVGAFAEEKLCAYGFLELCLPEDHSIRPFAKSNNGQEDFENIAVLDTIAVLPAYRGNKLQIIIGSHLLALALLKGKHTAYTTVSPKNVHSCNNLLAMGFTLEKEIRAYGGRERLLMRKSLYLP
jgi:hypothetical protein